MLNASQTKECLTSSALTAAAGQSNSGHSSNPSTHLEIKRYSSRRLYCRGWGQYITLRQVGQHIRNGGTIRVIDQATRLDVTQVVLRQVVAENVNLQAEELYQAIRKRGAA